MRDATDYYNLFPATLKNGNKQIIYLYNKRNDAIEKGKYINVSTGCLITRNSPYYKNKDFYFYDDDEFPLCYKFSCRGLARLGVIRKILKFYADGLREYERTKDEEKMKELVDIEVEAAKRNYEYLNKKNNGYDDLKLFNIPPHKDEPQEEENSFNTSSLIDNNNSYNDNNSFINDGEIEEEEEEEEEEYNDNDNDNDNDDGNDNDNINDNDNDNVNDNSNDNDNEEEDGDENKNEINETNKKEEENNKKRKGKLLIKNFNKYRKELDDLKEENSDGEDDLDKNEEEEKENDSDIIKTSFKKKKLCKSRFLNKKIKRNIITDSDDESNEKEEEKEEKEEKNEKEKEETKLNENIVEKIEEKAEINLEINIKEKANEQIEETSEIKNIFKKNEEELKYYDIFNNTKINKTKKFKINIMNKAPNKKSKLKQGNLNAFLKIIQ